MTFLYTKSLTLRKKQDNLRYIFIYKKPGTFVLRNFFIEVLKFAEGGGHLLIKKTIYFELHSYIEKKCSLRYTKSLTRCVIF